MSGAETVVLALAPFEETGEAAGFSDCPHRVPPTGEDFVRVGLMTNIPDQAVAGRIKDIMQGYRKLDGAKPRSKMPAGF